MALGLITGLSLDRLYIEKKNKTNWTKKFLYAGRCSNSDVKTEDDNYGVSGYDLLCHVFM